MSFLATAAYSLATVAAFASSVSAAGHYGDSPPGMYGGYGDMGEEDMMPPMDESPEPEMPGSSPTELPGPSSDSDLDGSDVSSSSSSGIGILAGAIAGAALFGMVAIGAAVTYRKRRAAAAHAAAGGDGTDAASTVGTSSTVSMV